MIPAIFLLVGPILVGIVNDPFFPLVSAIFSLVYVWFVLRYRELKLTWVEILFLIYMVWSAITISYSKDSYNGLIELTRRAAYFSVFSTVLHTADSPKDRRQFMDIAAGGVTLLAAWSLWIYVPWGNFGALRLGGPFVYPNWLGAYLAVGIPLVLTSTLSQRIASKKIVRMLAAAIPVAALYFTYSRGAWLSYAAALSIMILFGWARLRGTLMKNLSGVHVVAAILIGIVLLIQPVFMPKDYAGERLLSIPSQVSSNGRLDMWSDALDIFEDHFHWGSGLGSWQAVHTQYFTNEYARHAHSRYMETLAEEGVVGILFFTVLLWSIVLIGIRQLRTDSLPVNRGSLDWIFLLGIVSAATAFALNIGIELSWSLPPFTILFWAIAGIIPSHTQRQRQTDGTEAPGSPFRLLLIIVFLAMAFLSAQQYGGMVLGGRATKLQAANESDKALRVTTTAAKVDPWNQTRHVKLALALEKKAVDSNDPSSPYWNQALSEMERAIDLNPYHALNYRLLARFMIARNRYEDAVTALRKSWELYPKSSETPPFLAETLIKMNRPTEALKVVEEWLTRGPKATQGWLMRGDISVDLGNPEQALESYLKAVETAPDNALTHFKLGWFYETHNEPEKALAQYEAGLELDPTDRKAWHFGAQILDQLGRPEEAARWREQEKKAAQDSTPTAAHDSDQE